MEEEKILNVTQLQVVDKLQNEDVILLIRNTDNGKQCFQIKGFDFRGESAYEAALSQGFEGTYQDWVQHIKEITEYDTKSLLSFNGIANNDANSALRSGIYPSVTKNVPINGETFTIQTLRTTTAVYNQYVSTQIALGVTGAAIGKVYIRKNTQKSGTTYGDWIKISNETSITKKTKPKTQYIIGKAIPIGNLNGGARLNVYAVAQSMLQLRLTRLHEYTNHIDWKCPMDYLDKSYELLKDVTWHIFVNDSEVVTGKLSDGIVSTNMCGAYLRICAPNIASGFYSFDESKSSLVLAPDMYIYLYYEMAILDNFKGTSDTLCFHEGVKVWTPKGNRAPFIGLHNRFQVVLNDTVQLQKLLTTRHGSKRIPGNEGVNFQKISYRGKCAKKELTQYGVYRYRLINKRMKTRWYTVNIMKNGNDGKSDFTVKK